jgi:phosphoribosylformimino-5-aminoimidazole carboxamide ribonucleotide (ProFAR) isomerase
MSKKVLTDLDFQGVSKATNLPAPTQATDAATKAYVDSAGGVTTFAQLQDVNVANKVDQAVVYYNAADAKFKADGLNTILSLTDGGNF